MSKCVHNSPNPSVHQTLDELEFERGIWYAAQHNDIPRITHLLKTINDVNVEDNFGYTALHYASRNGHVEMCKLLISKGANVNALTRCGKVSPLHRCALKGHLNVFKLLIQSGASIDGRDGDGKTVLHRAAESGNVDITKEIIKLDPSLRLVQDNRGMLPQDYGSQEVVDILNFLK